MKQTRASNYAIAALTHLAVQKDRTRPLPSHQVAKAQGIPERFLLKVLKPLVGIGVLRSIKGPHGGYRLGREPEKINLLQVTEAVDGPIHSEPNWELQGSPQIVKKLREMHQRITDAERKEMTRMTVAQLITRA